jgi:hypothetical protein
MGRLGWGLLTVELNAEGRLIVAILIIFARRHAMCKKHNRLIVPSHLTLSLIALVGRHLWKVYSRSHEPIAWQRYLTARKDVRSYYHVDIYANRYATTEIAAHAWKRSRLHVAVGERNRTVCVIKALKNRHLVLEFVAQLSIVVDMNVENVAVLERRRQMNGRPPSANIAAWQSKRMSSPSIYV